MVLTMGSTSLYAVTEPGPLTVTGEMLSFGDTLVVIKDVTTFLHRVEVAAKSIASSLHYGPVEYVEREHHAGDMGPFRKYGEFSYQSEFRLVVDARTPTERPIQIDVGTLHDIAVIDSSTGFKAVAP